ncbi:hypothetical protein LTR62_000356 [Meristemomyces frigidus]|uniref:PH domain-like protein n=1 Tax=Meristemomyces frigidus TaxID=1508187 RepID=A0AAN7TP83_9PEZI|nr:hypothetical protein LTR62_000356 [Meristemomyces frigidus]
MPRPSKRNGSTRAASLQPQAVVQSDYDDTDAPTDAPPPNLPPPPQRSNVELNLAVLRRHAPEIEQILAIAPFAVLYTFSTDTQTWEKCGIEGTLFVCHLQGGRYNTVILNRKSLDNFIMELKSGDDVEITPEFVILQTKAEDGMDMINGIWIFEDGEGKPSVKEVVATTIQACALQAQMVREGEVHEHAYDVEEQEYVMDGTTQIEAQIQEEETVTQQAQAEKRLDLLQLFGGKALQPNVVPTPVMSSEVPPAEFAEARFTPTLDTDFFRKSSGPVAAPQAPPPTQQSLLLDLFKK